MMTSSLRDRRTLTLPPDLATLAAMIVLPGSAEMAAHVSRFPNLSLKAPLQLEVDDRGWYRVSLRDRKTGEVEAGHLRADTAADLIRRRGGWAAAMERVRAWWWARSGREAELRLRWLAGRHV